MHVAHLFITVNADFCLHEMNYANEVVAKIFNSHDLLYSAVSRWHYTLPEGLRQW